MGELVCVLVFYSSFSLKQHFIMRSSNRTSRNRNQPRRETREINRTPEWRDTDLEVSGGPVAIIHNLGSDDLLTLDISDSQMSEFWTKYGFTATILFVKDTRSNLINQKK